ncbi:helix-turn-helix domain-containing protein [Polynucleobacter sp. MWH-UH19D]|uniref:helix-turn-helix domain-containing protein n=1 Tax=Polynucleobacter sp. MWH-UH19D TaxID=1855610 RepID=UPI003364E26B
MNAPKKIPEIRKEAFAKARETLGLSAKELSGMACLSVRQIEQIENGEISSFYGPQVKFTAAKKVAGILKLSEEDAFDVGDPPPQESEVLPATESEAPETSSVIEKTISAEVELPEITESNVTQQTENHAEQTNSIEGNGVDTPPKQIKKGLYILVGIVAALVFSFVNLRPLLFPELVKEEIVLVEQVPATPPTDAPADSKAPLTASPEPTPAPTSTAAPAVVAAAPASTATPSNECPPADAAAVSFKPEAPKKAGDMVYLQSKIAQTICVVDASGKTQNKTLEPGAGASFYGRPPLKVFTSGVAQVDIYYQGVKVRPSNSAAKNIILEPAEVIQPSAPADSQLR